MLLISVSFQTLTDTQSQKDTKLQRCSGPSGARACSPDSNAVDHNSRDTKDTSVSAGSRRKHTVTRKNVYSRQKRPTTCKVRHTQSRRENNVQQRRRKNTVNVKYSRVATFRQVPNKRRVEVQGQNRDSLIRDVRTCLACPKTFPRSLTTLDERCHSYFIRMVSRTSSESDSSCNRVSNATGFVHGFMSFTSSSLNKGAPLAFRRLPDSKVGSKVHLHRFLAKNDSITARAGCPVLVRLSASIVEILTQ